MVFCGLCKENKETRYNWMIQEHGADAPINKFKICDDCATLLLRRMSMKVMGIREGQEIPNPLQISKTGIIEEMLLHNDNSLEITIALDIYKARRWIERGIEEDETSK